MQYNELPPIWGRHYLIDKGAAMDLCSKISSMHNTQSGSVPFHYDIILDSSLPYWLQASFPSVINQSERGKVLINNELSTASLATFPPHFHEHFYLQAFLIILLQYANKSNCVQLFRSCCWWLSIFTIQICGTRVSM